MAIDLQTFAAGDTDYIAKLNANAAVIEAAINALQTAQGGASGAFTVGSYFDAVFQSQTSMIGMNSYVPTISGTDLLYAAGSAYKASAQMVVSGIAGIVPFSGAAANTYYLMVDTTGSLQRVEDPLDALYSVVWTGSAFGAITRIAPTLFTAPEEDAARKSTALDLTFNSLDLRLESAESTAKAQATAALNAANAAQETADEALEAVGAAVPMHRVCLTIDGGTMALTTGIKGAIQVDFAGTIVGWSATAANSGSLTLEVSKKASSAPPAAPAIPDPATDKISASAPIQITTAQSASGGASQVTSWTKTVAAWDVLQFNLTAVTTITRVTIVLWIQE